MIEIFERKSKNVVLFSGGLDSLAALMWARDVFGPEDVLALYCNVGHRYANKEINAVMKICKKLHGQSFCIDSRLDLSSFEKPKEQNAIIPYRNTFFILMASLYLPEEGGNIILQNVVKGETSTIDRRDIFNRKLEEFLPYADGRKVEIITPHIGSTKAEICSILKNYISDARIPIDDDIILDTIGCYSEGDENCGECNSCFRSWVALKWAGVENIEKRFKKDPARWRTGINGYIDRMLAGKYDRVRVDQTFKVLQDIGVDVSQRTYVFDLDGVLTIFNRDQAKAGIRGDILALQKFYAEAVPNKFIIAKLTQLYENGNKIIIHTARHEEDRKITEIWLRVHNISYHELILGKPNADYYIDDRMLKMEDL